MEFSLCCRRERGNSDDRFTAWLGSLVITPPTSEKKKKKEEDRESPVNSQTWENEVDLI